MAKARTQSVVRAEGLRHFYVAVYEGANYFVTWIVPSTSAEKALETVLRWHEAKGVSQFSLKVATEPRANGQGWLWFW